MSTRNWLITGVSGGLGRALALKVIEQGDFVFATFRKESHAQEFLNEVGALHAQAFVLDVTEYEKVDAMINSIASQQKSIDILVNNAGYGLLGAVEEASLSEVRLQMEVNFFAPLNLTQKVLPFMREQGAGHILQVSSAAGFNATMGMGIYNASKYALEGFSQALALDLSDSPIKVTIIEPGPFRTQFGGTSHRTPVKKIAYYENTAHKLVNIIQNYSGTQDGDPKKAADVIFKIVNAPNAPLHLPLGPHSIERFESKMKEVQKDIDDWKAISSKTNFDS